MKVGMRAWRLSAVVAVSMLAAPFFQPDISASAAGASDSVVTNCAGDQLEVALAFGPGAAGHGSDVVLIANMGQRVCQIKGYPLLRFSTATSVVPVSITHTAYLFKNVRPTTVRLSAGRMASFGIDFGDTYTPKSDAASKCMVTTAFVMLGAHTYEIPFRLDVCRSHMHLGVTAIQSGA